MEELNIGVLALQGSFAEHLVMIKKIGGKGAEVRLPEDLKGLDGLIIPGGESTTIGKLAVEYGLMDPLRIFGRERAIWGTCAGAIFLSRDARRSQPLLELMDITVERNAYGRQIASFETELEFPVLEVVDPKKKPFPGIFIRAPLISSAGQDVEVLSRLEDGRIVAAQQGHLLATAFHPELTDDDRVHRYFMHLTRSARNREK
ncbi:MAG: pyridoxal 5'-phosphate synthase glutaminase subunit PdxT [Anaerolineales bacterium]|nr:pyridoxal 5'-phosphate synthase glutaminase subunit PdxT [Anaerolineales bacterium]